MHLFLYSNWWNELSNADRLFSTSVVVSSILLLIFFVLSYFDFDTESQQIPKIHPKKKPLIEAKDILYFFVAFSWLGLLGLRVFSNHWYAIVVAATAGIAITGLIKLLPNSLFSVQPRRRKLNTSEEIIESVGRVSHSIPPHRNGFGKIYLNYRTGPYELEAITAGDELPVGSTIRIVDVLDERVVLVERVTNSQRNVENLNDVPPNK